MTRISYLRRRPDLVCPSAPPPVRGRLVAAAAGLLLSGSAWAADGEAGPGLSAAPRSVDLDASAVIKNNANQPITYFVPGWTVTFAMTFTPLAIESRFPKTLLGKELTFRYVLTGAMEVTGEITLIIDQDTLSFSGLGVPLEIPADTPEGEVLYTGTLEIEGVTCIDCTDSQTATVY